MVVWGPEGRYLPLALARLAPANSRPLGIVIPAGKPPSQKAGKERLQHFWKMLYPTMTALAAA